MCRTSRLGVWVTFRTSLSGMKWTDLNLASLVFTILVVNRLPPGLYIILKKDCYIKKIKIKNACYLGG